MGESQTKANPRSSDSALFQAYLVCEKPLKRFLRRFCSRSEDVEDLAQEAFLLAFNAERGKEIRSPKAYLFRVARNIALRDLTKKSNQLTVYLEDAVDDAFLGREASSEEELIAQQKLEQCCKAVASLPEQCRRVFLLRKIHAHSHKEIAEQLGISPRTVEKHIAKGVDRFTDYMNNQEPTELQSKIDGPTTKHPWS
ncbi:sigma-70 family RNA polymerase sigma factor [Porticoccaceae bacterium]|nr:sigma-70 family RNA polymerase sigma factor [Porticoccaceae bacterium]